MSASQRNKGAAGVTVTPQYLASWARLFARSPAEIEAERQARTPAPPPQPPGSRRKS